MKKLLTLVLVLSMCPTAVGQISLKVYEADGVTPFDCNDDIMVGTKLTLIVSSDSNGTWSGGLFIAGQDRELGTLAGRDWDPNAIVSSSNDVISGDWTGSHFEEAGDIARVMDWVDSSICGFDLYTSVVCPNDWPGNPDAGDWFIIDYYAEEVGDCNVGFYDYYDYDISWSEPNYYITFSHVPTRDLNSDEVVNFGDFAIFSSQWYATDCNDPNWCDGADLERDGDVDCNDLGLFVEYWLWPDSGSGPNEPNEPNYPEEQNVIYRILGPNGSNEITIDVNQSITLYVTMETNDANIFMFDLEVNISDTNLGSIDNTEYPDGTAQILATPRDPFFDHWRPGWQQEEGIEFHGSSISSPLSDGNLASFVFTCEGQGDVTLTLVNWIESISPKLESIVIHQVDPNSQQMMGGEMGGVFGMVEGQQSETTRENNIDELASLLEEIWAQKEELRQTCSEAEWKEFIDSIKNALKTRIRSSKTFLFTR